MLLSRQSQEKDIKQTLHLLIFQVIFSSKLKNTFHTCLYSLVVPHLVTTTMHNKLLSNMNI